AACTPTPPPWKMRLSRIVLPTTTGAVHARQLKPPPRIAPWFPSMRLPVTVGEPPVPPMPPPTEVPFDTVLLVITPDEWLKPTPLPNEWPPKLSLMTLPVTVGDAPSIETPPPGSLVLELLGLRASPRVIVKPEITLDVVSPVANLTTGATMPP